jgi:hypothetical protein
MSGALDVQQILPSLGQIIYRIRIVMTCKGPQTVGCGEMQAQKQKDRQRPLDSPWRKMVGQRHIFYSSGQGYIVSADR